MATTRKPYVELFRDKHGRLRHRLRAANGQIVYPASEPYATATTGKRGANRAAAVLGVNFRDLIANERSK